MRMPLVIVDKVDKKLMKVDNCAQKGEMLTFFQAININHINFTDYPHIGYL
jgi:hypothetical protein